MAANPAIESIYPLSPMQQGLLFHALYQPGEDAYVEQNAFDLLGDLDIDAFIAAWGDITRRHAVLRTSFHPRDRADPVQVVHRDAPSPWTHVDLGRLGADARERAWVALVAADRRRGFDTARPPLQRFALLRLGPRRHRFLWTYHHLLLDGWSIPIVLGEFRCCYDARRRGETPALAEPRPYRDYIAWLATRNEGDTADFWRRYLRGFASATPLPMAHETPPETPEDQHVVRATVPPDATERLRAAARDIGVTLASVIHAVWALTLARHTGDRDVTFGSIVSNRPPQVAGVERIVGLLINAVPVRTTVEPDLSLADWLRGFHASMAELRQHEHTPLIQVQAFSDVPAGEPLFHSIVAFENYPLDALTSGSPDGLEIRSVPMGERTSYPLTLAAVPGRSMELTILAHPDRVSAATAGLLAGTLRDLVLAVADDPSQPVAGRLRGPDPTAERPAEFPRTHGISDLLDEHVRSAPDRVAIVDGDHHVTYAHMRRRADRTAAALAAAGTRPGDPVGVYLHRGRHLVTTLVAIVDLGATYVPLDPGYPADRLRYMIADGGIRTVCTATAYEAEVTAVAPGLVQLPVDRAGTGTPPARPADGPETTVYVIYTSGSTGTPKGIAIPRRAVVRLVRETGYVALGPSDRVALASSVTFDAATFEIWGALLNGATMVTVDRDTALSAARYADTIAGQALTVMFVTTALFNQIAVAAPTAFAPLRCLLMGGEAIDPDTVRAVLGAGPPARLVHVYGPTESTTFATSYDMRVVPLIARTVPIGRAISHTTAAVLDGALDPVAPGALGELYLGGLGLAHGYVGQPALTALRFVPDPFGAEPGSRLYRTGDLVRSGPDGELTFIGRADGQVKLRGFRIELGEIESELRRDPGVSEAAVLLREDRPGDQRLVAYVVTADGADAASRLRARCAARLPEFMVPSSFVAVDRLPLTPNGKVDRRALPAPPAETRDGDTDLAAPRHGVEEIVAAAWQQVLGTEAVGRHDNFFALGGHSLLAAQLQARLRVSLGTDVPIRAIFQSATLSHLVEAIDAQLNGPEATSVALPPLVTNGRRSTYPLSPAQQRLWFLEQWEPGTPLYHITGSLAIRGDFDVAAFVRAWLRLVVRHDSLRTRIVAGGSEVLQTVAPAPAGQPLVVDVTRLDPTRRPPVVERLAAATTDTPFDLTHGPLWRVSVIRTRPDEHVLALALHHLIADGRSVDIVLGELAGTPKPLTAQYGDYVEWQRSWMATDRPARELAYWRERLGPNIPALPTDYPRPAGTDHRGAHHVVELPAETSARVAGFARRTGLTTFMTALSVFAIALGDNRGLDEVVIGTPIANRPDERLDPLVGFFVNTLALRVKLPEDATFGQFTAHVREVCLGAYTHQFLPYEKVVQEVRPGDQTPLFQAWFVVQDTPPVASAFDGLTVTPFPHAAPPARYDLRMDYQQRADGPQAVIEYRTALFEPGTIARLGRRFSAALGIALDQPDLTLAEIRRRAAAADDDARGERRATVSLASLHRLKSARRVSYPPPSPDEGESA